MRKITVVLGLTLLAGLGSYAGHGRTAGHSGRYAWLEPMLAWAASPGAPQAKQPKWSSTEEYNAFNAMATEKDPRKRISLAEAFTQKFSTSDFKANAYLVIMQSHQQVGDSAKAIEAGRKAQEIDPDNLGALNFLSFAFPFVFKPTDADAAAQLSRAESDGKHGLEVLQNLKKPDNVPEDQFNQQVKALRANFNSAVGFVTLQRKDYPAAITSYKAATEDNPSDFYSFYRMGLAYLFSTPRDYDHAVWYMARAVSLAKSAKDPNGEAFEKYLKQTYVGYHGNDKGLSDILAQVAASANPPEGFKVAAMDVPKATGNKAIDAFNEMTFPLKLGGEKAEQQWQGLKGQPLQLSGFIDSVEKGADGDTYLVRIDILDQSKAAEGVYDIELKDATQPNVKNLSKGDPVTFKGTLTAYTATPNLVLSLDGEITTPLPEKSPVKEKPKPTRKPPQGRKPVRRTQG